MFRSNRASSTGNTNNINNNTAPSDSFDVRPGCYVTVYIRGRGVLVGTLKEPHEEYKAGDRIYVRLSNGDYFLADLEVLPRFRDEHFPVNSYFIQVRDDTFLSGTLSGQKPSEPKNVLLAKVIHNHPSPFFMWGDLAHYDSYIPPWARPTGH